MAEHTSNSPVELGAEMDYPQHKKSYDIFVGMTKYASLHIAALLIAMAFAFFTSAGFFSALILFIIISALGYWILR